MRITESKLRQMIRGIIREFTSSATAGGAKKGGFQSKTRKAAQSDYDTKSKDYDTKSRDYDTKKAAVDKDKQYKASKKRAADIYSGVNTGKRPAGYGSWVTNPDYTSDVNQRDKAKVSKDSAETAKTSAKSTLDTEKAADLEKTVPKQKPPRGGGAGFGKGKSAGKGKSRKKKN